MVDRNRVLSDFPNLGRRTGLKGQIVSETQKLAVCPPMADEFDSAMASMEIRPKNGLDTLLESEETDTWLKIIGANARAGGVRQEGARRPPDETRELNKIHQ